MSPASALRVYSDGDRHWLKLGERRVQCAIGRGEIGRKRGEGDGVTPRGTWPLRCVLYRPDREAPPPTDLPCQAISPDDGWCDDPAHPDYNQMIHRPFAARHELLWRDDGLYDLIVVVGFNDDPIINGQGSAIFMHIAKREFAPTEGCVALARDDLLAVLATINAKTVLRIE